MEHSNAAEWDLHHRQDRHSLRGDTSNGWQTVSKPDEGNAKVVQQSSAAYSSISKTPKPNRSASLLRRRSNNARPQRKWQDARGRPLQPQQHSTRALRLIEDAGNEAQAQWRALEPAKLFVRVPKELVLSDGEDALQRLARERLTFIASDHRPAASPESQMFGIWGSGKDAEATRLAIIKWIEEVMGPQKSGRAAKFAKLASMTPVLRQRAENRWKREVQHQRFRRHPPLDMAFGAIGMFHWPVKDYSPTQILGPSYEALDPIRMDCSCYVVWKKSGFQVMGKNMDKVKAALLRLKQTVFQIVAKQLPTTRMYLLHWPHDLRSDSVRLKEYEQPRQLSGPQAAEIKLHPAVHGEGVRDEQDGAKQSRASERRIHSTVLRTLSRLPYYRGSIKLRIHFGRFLATQYMLPENGLYDLEEYESMTKESQFQGLITNELGDREMEQAALASLHNATELLIPLDPATEKLSDIKPKYTVVFTFADKLGDLQLTRSWQPAQDNVAGTALFDSISEKWTRLDRETRSTSSLLDICLTDLSTSFGLAFTVEAAQAVDENRIEPALVNFAHNLSVDARAALRQATDKPFVKFKAYVPNTVLKSFDQRITYAYAMKDFDYNVEVTRFQRAVYPDRRMGSIIPSAASQIQIFEPRWSVSVHRVEWDTSFAENERLNVGDKASWNADSERWFPKGWSDPEETDLSRYFSNMVGKLNRLGTLLRDGGKVEDLLGGMSIG